MTTKQQQSLFLQHEYTKYIEVYEKQSSDEKRKEKNVCKIQQGEVPWAAVKAKCNISCTLDTEGEDDDITD